MTEGGDAPGRVQLVVVFAPGLWPYRSQLDALSWLIGRRMARALGAIPGLIGYASTRARSDRGAGRVEVLRSLPPDHVVLAECSALGARWAVTGRLLADVDGMEAWLNLLDGSSGALLWTRQAVTPSRRLLLRLTQLFGELVAELDASPDHDAVAGLFPTLSYEALLAYARARDLHRGWNGADAETGMLITRLASRAAALDPAFGEAAELLLEVGPRLAERLERVDQCEELRGGIVGSHDFEPARTVRQAIHSRLLALARE